MVCEASMSGFDYLMSFEFIKALTCTYANSAGFLATGLIVYGGVAVSIYIRTNSVVIPFVLLLLVGGAIIPQVAGVGVAVATILFLATGAGVLTFLYHRHSR